jgi:CHAD domain-containing protein
LKHLDEVKDAIGDWHDWVELVGIAEKSLKHDRCKLVPRIKTIAAAKYEHALSLSDKFARRYLAAKPARGKRRAKGDSVSPALKAATSIAEP